LSRETGKRSRLNQISPVLSALQETVMTLSISLLDARAGVMAREAFSRLSSRMGAVFSKSISMRPSPLLRSCPESVDKGLVQRRYRLEITLLGRETGEQLLKQVSSMLSANGITVHSARLNLRGNGIGSLKVETLCTCEERAKLVQFVDHASRTPGVIRVRWESIPTDL